MFIQRTLQLTLSCQFIRFVAPTQNIIPEKFDEFFACERAVGGQHLLANEYNLRLLGSRGVRKIALLVRDPRDALISWWHHWERSDIKPRAREFGLPPNYYELEPQSKLRCLIELFYPRFQRWMADWVKVAARSSGLDCHIFAYENFVSDRQGSVRRLLSFFGHELDPVFPELSGLRRAGIDMATHFRRGQVGSYGDEASPDLVALLNDQLNTDLAARFGWGA